MRNWYVAGVVLCECRKTDLMTVSVAVINSIARSTATPMKLRRKGLWRQKEGGKRSGVKRTKQCTLYTWAWSWWLSIKWGSLLAISIQGLYSSGSSFCISNRKSQYFRSLWKAAALEYSSRRIQASPGCKWSSLQALAWARLATPTCRWLEYSSCACILQQGEGEMQANGSWCTNHMLHAVVRINLGLCEEGKWLVLSPSMGMKRE